MKTKYINILASLLVAGAGMMTSSCSLDLENPDGPTATGYFDSQDKFVLNMIAIMQEWRGDFDVNTMRAAGELRSGIYSLAGSDGSGLNDIPYLNNNLSAANNQLGNFANFYGVIGNINAFIHYAEENKDVFNSESARNYLLGMAHGMRAYCYFQLHKMYGTCPLRLEPDVLLGNFDAVALALPRADAEAVLTQIKSDITTSLNCFNNGSFTDQRITGVKCNFWTKAATEMLAGEVYLWSGKVSTDNHTANPADVTTAKGYFQNVIKDYGFSMQSNYADVFAKGGNSEVIFSTYYGYGVATANWYYMSLWNPTTGMAKGAYWQAVGEDGITATSYANRLAYYMDGAGKQQFNNFYFHGPGNIVNRYQYKNAVWYQFDEKDTRRDAQLLDFYLPTNAENGLEEDGETEIEGATALQYIADFNKDDYHMAGIFLFKYRGEEQNGNIVGTNHMIYYRLPLAYTYLAEIANYEGDNAGVESNLNELRKRAYGSAWDETTYGYKAGSFRENEAAILIEKTKEFLAEGQRWWDIRRMTAVKGGTDADHFVFQPESSAGFGLDVASHPNWNETCGKINLVKDYPVITNVPTLDYSTKAHMVLWPIPTSLISDVVLQTPGY